MSFSKEKSKSKIRLSWWLPLLFLCVSVLFFSYSVSEIGFALESSGEPSADWLDWDDSSTQTSADEPNYLVEWDAIVVTGVANTIEYLTSLYLYVTDPYASTSVEMKYSPELNALLINSPINANALGIWFNKFSEWVVWSVFVWWSWNRLELKSEWIYDDYWDWTWSKNSYGDASVVIWWESNRPSADWSVIVWWRNNSIWFSNSAMIWSVESSLAWHTSVDLWSRKSSLNVQDWNSINMWYNNHGDKYTFLIWSWIDTHGWISWVNAVWSLFAYSPGTGWFAVHWWNLWWQPWFYVNVKNGFGLNTSTPRLTFDFRSWWPLKVVNAKWIHNNTLTFVDWWRDGIICEDEFAVEKFRWTLAYVKSWDIAWFCWCNGKVWMPLSAKAAEQSLCAEAKADARVCDWAETLHNVIFNQDSAWAPRWDENANDWKWAWINLNWTFMWIPSVLSWDIRECSYTCAVWYHPNQKSAKWWFTGDCVACDDLTGWVYVSPGTWVNDCEFRCNAWYKYYKWAENKSERCTPCKAWEWTPDLNESINCNACRLPYWVSAKTNNSKWGIVFTGWVLWNWTTWSWEPYFRKFTSFAWTEDGCKFECASWFFLWSGGAACIECWTWTYSPGGLYDWEAGGVCASCTNMEKKSIKFSINGDDHEIPAEEVSWYTTKWTNWPESCEWICNPSIWLVKSWNTCKCPDDSHLELVDGNPSCISNIGDLECTWAALWALAIKWPSLATWVSVGTLNWNDWTERKVTWNYVNWKENLKLKACERTCPEDYIRDWNDCKLPPLWVCGSKNGQIVDSLWNNELCQDPELWSEGFKRIEINYYFDNKFQFYPGLPNLSTNPIKYLATWTCKWYKWKSKYSASCYAFIKWEPGKAQCPSESQWRDASGSAKAMCLYDTTNNCKEGLNCPPVVNERAIDKVIKDDSIDLDNVSPHWLLWSCPGTFWAAPTPCHSCDSRYNWWVKKWGCTIDEFETHCKTKDSGSSDVPPSDRQLTNFWPEVYTNKFDVDKDDYLPWVISYSRLADWASTKNPCEWACQAWAHWCSNSARCERNPDCWEIRLDWSWNLVEGYERYLCDVWYESDVSTGSDGKFSWECRDRSSSSCEYVRCGEDSYTCWGTAPNHTVNVGPTDWLYAHADYRLYPSVSEASWIPCSLVCDSAYKYVDGECVQFSCPEGWISNAERVANGKYSQLSEEPTQGNVLYETVAEAEANPCGYVCKEDYKYKDGVCVCKEGAECDAEPECWKPDGEPWNRRHSPQYCEDAFSPKGSSEYNTCIAGDKIYKYCGVWTRTGFVKKYDNHGYLDHVEWICENWGVEKTCQSKGCTAWTDNVNPNTLCLNEKNSDSIYVNRKDHHIRVFNNGYDSPWQNDWLKLWFGVHWDWLRWQWYVEYESLKKPTTWVRADKITFSTDDKDYCRQWDLTLVQCPVGQYCEDDHRYWKCCSETRTRTDSNGTHVDCVDTSITVHGSVDDYWNLIIDD